jgi:hypothetical protein
VPGWHTIVYPPKYIAQMIFIAVSLLLSAVGYSILAYKGITISNKVFAMHFLFTLPLIIALFKTYSNIDMDSISREGFHDILTKREWIEYLIFSFFTMAQIIFLFNFINRLLTEKQKWL